MKIHFVSIIIPTFNESAYILRCLENVIHAETPHYSKEIIVVDDGSTDDTVRLVTKFQREHKEVRYITQNPNQGKGAAIKKGLQHIKGEIVIIQDADLEYDPSDYQRILEKYNNNNVNVVYGSRILGARIYNNYSANFIFYLGGITLTSLVNVFLGTKLTDQPTGYKSWRSEFSEEIIQFCKSNKFAFEIELTGFFAKKKEKIHEVPIHYYPRTVSHGKKIGLPDFIESFFMLLSVRNRKNPS